MKKTTLPIIIILCLPFMLKAQFDILRSPYQNPNQIGFIIDSSILPAGNFKTVTSVYDAQIETWRMISETLNERVNNRIIKSTTTNYSEENPPNVLVTMYKYKNELLNSRSTFYKSSTSFDTTLYNRDTFYYENDKIVKHQTALNIPPRTSFIYDYDSINQHIATRIEIYDSSMRNITYSGSFEVVGYHHSNAPTRINNINYLIGDTFFVEKRMGGYVKFNYDSINRLTSKLNYISPFGSYILSDSISVQYNINNNPKEILIWSSSSNKQNNIITYFYNDQHKLLESIERLTDGTLVKKITYSDYFSASSNNIAIQDDLLLIYPNPAITAIKIEVAPNVRINKVTLYNSSGTNVLEKLNPNKKIDIQYLPPGLYHVEINTNHGKLNKRLVIK